MKLGIECTKFMNHQVQGSDRAVYVTPPEEATLETKPTYDALSYAYVTGENVVTTHVLGQNPEKLKVSLNPTVILKYLRRPDPTVNYTG